MRQFVTLLHHMQMQPTTSCSAHDVVYVQLDEDSAVADYHRSRRRLLVLGYNATLTTAVEAPRQPNLHFDQIQVGPSRSRTSHDRLTGEAARTIRVHVDHQSDSAASSWLSHVPWNQGAACL